MQKQPQADEQEYKISDDKGAKQVLIRSKLGAFLLNVYGNALQDETNKRFFENANCMVQSADGKYVVVASDKRVMAVDLVNDKKVYDEEFTFIYYVALSPAETFLQIFDKFENDEGRTILLSLPEFKKVRTFDENYATNFINKQSYPLLKFTSDDSLILRYNKKTVEMFTKDLKQAGAIESGILDFITVSRVSKEKDYVIVACTLDKKTYQGKIFLYNSTSLQKPVYTKNIDKAEEIKVKFSPVNHDFLIELQTYFDHSGKSYYGEYGLYFFNSNQLKMTRVKTYEGPIHDFSWDPTGARFAAISGYMPAGAVLFNNKNEPVFEFGKLYKNLISWNPQGRFICLAGFGNLNGDVEIWDIPLTKKIGECKSSSASCCLWAPDGRKFLTAIVTPRLRVDNCYKLFAYTGTLLKTFDLAHTQLYEVQWRNSIKEEYKVGKGVSPGRKIVDFAKKAQEKKFFRPMGSSIASEIIKAQMGKTDARVLSKNENFGVTKPKQAPIEQTDEEKPKKNKKNKKNSKQDD